MANVTIMGADYQNVNEIYLRDTDTGNEVTYAIGGGGLETENIVSEQSVNCSISLGSIYGGFINEHSAFPENQNYYLVTLDGVDYIARAYYASAGYLIVGDNRINQGADYAYVMFPFSIVHEGNYFYLSVQTSGVHTLKVDKVLSFGIS